MIRPVKELPELSENDKTRFWSKVDKSDPSGCWKWKGTKGGDGYGLVKIARRMYRAHRMSWFLINGPFPSDLFLCHACDVALCCNPNHCFIGTALDNNRDRKNKGRGAHGETHGSRTCPGCMPCGERVKTSKLTVAEVRAIRDLAALGIYSQEAIAARFNVMQTTISHIVRRESWNHVK